MFHLQGRAEGGGGQRFAIAPPPERFWTVAFNLKYENYVYFLFYDAVFQSNFQKGKVKFSRKGFERNGRRQKEQDTHFVNIFDIGVEVKPLFA